MFDNRYKMVKIGSEFDPSLYERSFEQQFKIPKYIDMVIRRFIINDVQFYEFCYVHLRTAKITLNIRARAIIDKEIP